MYSINYVEEYTSNWWESKMRKRDTSHIWVAYKERVDWSNEVLILNLKILPKGTHGNLHNEAWH